MSRPPKELVNAIVASLERGEGWSFDQFNATHKESCVEIWIANNAWGMSIKLRANHSALRPCVTYGGGVLEAMPFGWRNKIMRAVRRANPNRNRDRVARALTARAIGALLGDAC